MDRIKAAAGAARHVTIVGAGFIGLEMAEQLALLGKKVTLVEAVDQIPPPLDRPMTALLEDELRKHGIELHLGDPLSAFEPGDEGVTCRLVSGSCVTAELVILAIGVRPETTLARAAGLFPGAKPVLLKLVWNPQDQRVLGAQVTGFQGVDKRLDVIATAITVGIRAHFDPRSPAKPPTP